MTVSAATSASILLAIASCSLRPAPEAAARAVTVDRASHTERWIRVGDGTRIHLLDFGRGAAKQTILLLSGLGASGHTFDDLAPSLRPMGHVVAITRRGTRPSDQPDHGYDIATRVADDRAILDSIGADRVIVVAHSIASSEAIELGRILPLRVTALVFLDAAYDRSDPAPQDSIASKAIGRLRVLSFADALESRERSLAGLPAAMRSDLEVTQRGADGALDASPPGPIYLALTSNDRRYVPSFASLPQRVLAIYALSPRHPLTAEFDLDSDTARRWDEWWTSMHWPWQQRQISSFQRALPCAKTVTLNPADHLVYFSNAAQVTQLIKSFLASHEGTCR
jgi:pimeloyl-ACP methyl ester carboxylesterase